jgi:hypothetical protein
MAARFGTLGTQYFTDDNVVLGGGSVTFYEPGTTTLKATYSDSALTIQNTNPVLLDAAGRLPNVFFSGLAKAVLKDSEGEIIETRDPVGDFSAGDESFSTWSADVLYSVNAVVAGSDGYFYVSQINANIANDPTTSPTEWKLLVEQLGFGGTNNGNVYVVDTSNGQGIGNVPVASIRALVPITTVSASNVATVDFTGIDSTYDEYQIHAFNVIPQTDDAIFQLRTSSNNGSSFDAGAGNYQYNVSSYITGATQINLSDLGVSNNAGGGVGWRGIIYLFSPSNTAVRKEFMWNYSSIVGGGSLVYDKYLGVGRRDSTAIVNAVRLFFASGNITSGTFTLYGVRRT